MAEDTSVTTGAAPTPTAPPATATPAATAQPVATPQATQTPATGGENREGWVPSYRVRETREAAIREANESFSQKEAQYRQQLEQVQSQLRALVGVQPPSNPEIDAVKTQFGDLFPGLSKLEAQAAQIEALLERAGDIDNQSSHYWQQYGRSTMDNLFKLAETSLGSPLTDAGKRQLHASFTGFVQSSPELTARYANDPTILEDFWKDFSSSFIDPVRRVASATTVARVAGAIPQDTPSGAVSTTQPVPLKNLDERATAAWALYQQNKK